MEQVQDNRAKGTGLWNICKSKNNMNNKTIREIWVQKGNPKGQGQSVSYFGSELCFRVQSLMFRVVCIFFQLNAQ